MRVLRISKIAPPSLSRFEPSRIGRALAFSIAITPHLVHRSTFSNLHCPLATHWDTGKSSLPRTMAENKSGKQATLGYVRNSQQTIGCVERIWMAHASFSTDKS